MRKVAIVNGLVRQAKYNQHLAQKYADIGYTANEYSFNPYLLFCCSQHHRLQKTVQEIIGDNDLIHCQSGGYFPVVHHYYEKQSTKPFILETPVFHASPGTFFAATGYSSSYATAPESKIVQKFLDVVCFTPEWRQSTLDRLQAIKERNLTLILASTSDNVSDNRNYEHYLDHNFTAGKHARLFYDNDFQVIHDFLARKSNKL